MDGEQVATETPVSTPAAVTSDPSPQTEPTPEPVQNGAANGDARPAGWDTVEIPPELKPRFGRIYKEMKDYQRDANELRDINRQLLTTVEQLQTTQGEVITHLKAKDFVEAESQLNTQRQQAWDKGDVSGFNAANDRLMEIKARKIAAEMVPAQKTQPVTQQPQNAPISGGDFVNMAVQKGLLQQDEATVYKTWASETDENGNLRRPWVNESDMRNSTAAYEGRAVFNNPSYENKPFADKLKEIDRRMGLANTTQTGGPGVLPAGNLTRGTKTDKVALTPWQETVAVRTKFGGPKAKSDSDHIEAYRKAVLKTKGGRR